MGKKNKSAPADQQPRPGDVEEVVTHKRLIPAEMQETSEVEPEEVDDLESFRGNGKVRIYRVNSNGRQSLIANMDRDTITGDYDFIAHKFGGGTYLYVFTDEHGKVDFRVTKDFDMKAYPGEGAAAGGMSAEMMRMLEASREESKAANDRVLQIMAESNKNTMNMVVAILGKDKQNTTLDDLAKLKTVLGDGSNMKLIEMFAPRIMDLITDKLGNTPGASDILSGNGNLLEKGAALLELILSRVKPSTGQPPIKSDGYDPNAHAPKPALPAPAGDTQDGSIYIQAVRANKEYQLYVPKIRKAFDEKKTPREAAQIMVDEVAINSIERLDSVRASFVGPQGSIIAFFTILEGKEWGEQPFAGWLEEMYAWIWHLLDEENVPAPVKSAAPSASQTAAKPDSPPLPPSAPGGTNVPGTG